ncbi:MAG: hypothetical protein Q8O44_00440, partial [Syntrophales bacterium]|nr:hypothetical protein [Syntrophales bacterium]
STSEFRLREKQGVVVKGKQAAAEKLDGVLLLLHITILWNLQFFSIRGVCDKNVGIILLAETYPPLWKRGAGGIRNKSKRIFIAPSNLPQPLFAKEG